MPCEAPVMIATRCELLICPIPSSYGCTLKHSLRAARCSAAATGGRVLGKGSAAARACSLVCLDKLVQQRNSQIKRLVRSDFDADSAAVEVFAPLRTGRFPLVA